jgi:hypothetical protein
MVNHTKQMRYLAVLFTVMLRVEVLHPAMQGADHALDRSPRMGIRVSGKLQRVVARPFNECQYLSHVSIERQQLKDVASVYNRPHDAPSSAVMASSRLANTSSVHL